MLEQENYISFDFENTFVDTSQGLKKFTDTKDDKTYIFSNSEPFYCHRWFPCFDQPDIRACLTLQVITPPAKDWHVISNAKKKSIKYIRDISKVPEYAKLAENESGTCWIHIFEKGPSISCYLYNLCVGQFDMIENEDSDAQVPMRIFLRNSKREHLDHKELFRVIKEGIKFYERYTLVKFPFQKYDQIFCPDFTDEGMENVGAVTLTDDFLQPKE